MRNDDEKYEGHDENEEVEYHFSDEEVYDVETDASHTDADSGESAGGAKASVLSRLSRSKRMFVSAGVFFVLVFVVYKMVAPSSTPSTDIAAPVVAQQSTAPKNAAPGQPAAPMTASAPSAPMVVTVPPIPAPAPAANSVAANAPQGNVVVVEAPAQAPAQAPAPATTVAVAPTATAASAMPTIAPAAPQAMQNTLPLPSQPASSGLASLQPIDAKMATMNMEAEKLISQSQAEYAQKLSAYETQNKALQDQLQSLNSRVGSMETQLNQLVQALIHQQNSGSSSNTNTNAAPAEVQAAPVVAETKINYNVQAIIPGRAWLKSNNGETITVAEGDSIKGVGRVTKIDPYDGVIEINTGTKQVSLSYGNSG